jgi:AcrR family transcriptional regulator
MAQLTEKDTRERILDAAERLFADQGFRATPLRAITAEAGVNLAAVNYHFGSKGELVRAVLRRRLEPLNLERLAALDRVESSFPDGSAPLEQVVEAFVGPVLEMSRDPERGGHAFMRLFGHAVNQPDTDVRDFVLSQFGDVARRFHRAFCRVLPELDEREVFWRMVFMVGSMSHSMLLWDQIPEMIRVVCRPERTTGIKRRLIPFLAAALRAPMPRAGDQVDP